MKPPAVRVAPRAAERCGKEWLDSQVRVQPPLREIASRLHLEGGCEWSQLLVQKMALYKANQGEAER